MLGDWRLGIAIAERLLDSALNAERRGEAFQLSEELQASFNKLGGSDALSDHQGVVTRPTDFQTAIPTFIVLGDDFLEEAVGGEGVGGAVQFLLAKATTELAYQLLRGEVDDDELRPKIVSMVRQTFS
jgi:hypothetical protein